jgi:ArsR family transcriptional regulator
VSVKKISKKVSPKKLTRITRARQTAILKALADPRRFELLKRVACSTCPVGCGEARIALSISPATLSHHIKELETAGLVHVEREGKFHYLTLRAEVWAAFLASLAVVGRSV